MKKNLKFNIFYDDKGETLQKIITESLYNYLNNLKIEPTKNEYN